MLDLVNHHPSAPAYAHEDGYLSISTWRAADRGECFVSYGSNRDVLGIALAYGYVDRSITRVNALPGEYALTGGGTLRLVRASRPEVTHEPGSLTIIGAAWDPSDPGVQHHTLLEPIERHLRDRGLTPMKARYHARVLEHRIRESDEVRTSRAQALLIAHSGTSMVRESLRIQHETLLRM